MGLIGNKRLNEGVALPTIIFSLRYLCCTSIWYAMAGYLACYSHLFHGTIVLEGLILMLVYADCGVVLGCSD